MSKSASLDLISTGPAKGPNARPFAERQSPAAHPRSLLDDLSPGDARESLLAVQKLLRTELPATRLSVYEAGGGSTCFLPLDMLRRAEVTAVDIDAEQLRNNEYAQERILGDIQTYRFDPDSFDLVICYNVIEHVRDVEAALIGFFESIKRGGLILIGAPNPKSLSGVVTKYTPHWFHVWFYRYVIGNSLAGQPGQPPFPTYFHPMVTPSKLEAFAEEYGLEVIYRKEYESPRFPEMRARTPLFAATLDIFAVAINALLPRGADVRHSDYHIIIRRR